MKASVSSSGAGDPESAYSDLLVQQKMTNALLAAQLRSSFTQAELVLLLARTGASHQEIADVLGTTAPTVSNVLVRARKRTGGKK